MTDLRPIYFHEAKSRLVGNRLTVYAALQQGPATPKELAARMSWDKCSVRPRLTDLRAIRFAETTGILRNGEHEFRALSADEVAAVLRAEAHEHEVSAGGYVTTQMRLFG